MTAVTAPTALATTLSAVDDHDTQTGWLTLWRDTLVFARRNVEHIRQMTAHRIERLYATA